MNLDDQPMMTDDLGSRRKLPQTSLNESTGSGETGRLAEVGRRADQIAEVVELVRSGRSVVLTGERSSGRTTALRSVLRSQRGPTLTVSASESARSIPLGALAGLVTLEPQMSPTARVMAAIDGLRSTGAVVAVDDADVLDDESATVMLAVARDRPVILTLKSNACAPDAVERIVRDHATVVELVPLCLTELRDVAERCLGGLLDAGSLERLCEGVDGIPGRLLDSIARARSEGLLRDHEGVWSCERRAGNPPGAGSSHHRRVVDARMARRPEESAVGDAERALRRGDPEAAARHLAPIVVASRRVSQGREQALVTAQLRWALAWAGRVGPHVRLALVPSETSPAARLAGARAAAEHGDDAVARAAALAVAELPDAEPSTHVDALHLAGRLGIAGSIVRRIATIVNSASSDASHALMETQLAHLRGLDRKDTRELEGAAERFRQLGYLALAHESMTQAALIHQLTGTPRHAGRCRADAEAMAANGVRPTFAARHAHEHLPLLTRRERTVVSLIADGRTLREVAAELGCAPRTAESHLQHAYVKLGVNDRIALRSIVAGV